MTLRQSLSTTLEVRGVTATNVFSLMGDDENSATFALGWALSRCPSFLAVLVTKLVGKIAYGNVAVVLQRHAAGGGFTDIEISAPGAFHIIVEAKKGWEVPSLGQLQTYAPRFAKVVGSPLFLTVSAASAEFSRRNLPLDIGGVPCVHMSWTDIRSAAAKASRAPSKIGERLWLSELMTHLTEYVALDRLTDNRVYVVSLNNKPARSGGTTTFIDVVERDKSYFHPVGNRWPNSPITYIGFRYDGRLQSVHHVVSSQVVQNVASVNPEWSDTEIDHFVYRLGPPMRPPLEMRTGAGIQQSRHAVCIIDTLLSGAFSTIADAEIETRRRLAVPAEIDID